MFLKFKILTVLVLSLFNASSFAQQASNMEAGHYRLVEGEKGLCRNFELSLKDLKNKHITISGIYGFELRNSVHQVQSDLDAECVFKEQNKFEVQNQEAVLTRINQEVCNGNIKSKTVSFVLMSSGKITLRHLVDDAAITCRWEK